MNAPTRIFEVRDAVRESVPLLVGIMGPSGSGKTWSALRLATGIQQVTGGDIYGIDTEARRMLHYADAFRFKYLQFGAPFGSLDYLAAIRQCVTSGAKVIIIDSASHEHSGEGGYLMTQAAELDRMAGSDYAKRERVKMAAWIKPAQLRSQMINGILQLGCNLIWCFRAKEKTKPIRKPDGKIEIKEMGFMPIAGEELLFEMTANCLLLPKSNGIPTWNSDEPGEKLMMKLPEQFRQIFAASQPLSEDIGRQLATWAAGGQAAKPETIEPTEDAKVLWASARGQALKGQDALQSYWKSLTRADRAIVKIIMDELKVTATEADAIAAESLPSNENVAQDVI